MNAISWYFPNREHHTVYIFGIKDGCYENSGVYLLAKYNPDRNSFRPLYIGEAENIHDRLMNGHHKKPDAINLGATHALLILVELKNDRKLLETKLIQYFDPELNESPRSHCLPSLGLSSYATTNFPQLKSIIKPEIPNVPSLANLGLRLKV